MQAELLVLIDAEKEADRLVKAALERKREEVAQALQERERLLAEAATEIVIKPRSGRRGDAVRCDTTESRKSAAVRLVLEAMIDAA